MKVPCALCAFKQANWDPDHPEDWPKREVIRVEHHPKVQSPTPNYFLECGHWQIGESIMLGDPPYSIGDE